VRAPQVIAVVARPQQPFARLALALASQVRQQELRQRHRALLVRFGTADVDPGARLHGVLGDACAPAQHVKIVNPQTDGLSPQRKPV
jgi:hypothetical protein